MLKKLRVAAAAICFTLFCLLFTDVSGLPPQLAILAKAQLIPAILSGSVAVVVALVVVTLLFGRVYCSVLCPLGLLQDVFSRMARKSRFQYTQAKNTLRLAALALFAAAFFAGIPFLFSLLEPYSAFGRIAADMLSPVWQSASNVLNMAAERAGSFAVGPTPVWQKGLSAMAAAVFTLAVVGILAWRGGRTWCNTLCPAGALLGFLSRFSLLKPRIDASKCVHCGVCTKMCKASCIDGESGVVDAGRCVACFNCLANCRAGAISYAASVPASTSENGKPNFARRGFLAGALGMLGTFVQADRAVQARDLPQGGKIQALTRKERPSRSVPVIPPGAHGLGAFRERCTGCQLCVAACPNQVLSSFDHGMGMFQPALSFERGYCRTNCVTCSSVCPTGAIRSITPAEKSATQIGRAIVTWEHCINSLGKEQCTACARNCPPGAIRLTQSEDGSRRLVIDAESCTGCGACEYLCPARPLAAIQIEGNLEHRRI